MPAIDPLGPMVRIRDLRLAHGLTLAEAARRIREQGAEVTESGLSNVENGRRRASDRLLMAWAKALGVNHLDVWQGPVIETAAPDEQPERVA